MAFRVPNKYRIRRGPMSSDDSIGNAGAFEIYGLHKNQQAVFYVIASDGEGWEHVSIHGTYLSSGANFTPNWEVMCKIKDMFWDEEDCVVQFHPPKSEYVNRHPNTLHLWRKVGVEFETPHKILVD